MQKYMAWYEDANGDRTEYHDLTRSRAIWRDGWMTRNATALRLKRWGWERKDA